MKKIHILVAYYETFQDKSFTDALKHSPEYKNLSWFKKLWVEQIVRRWENARGPVELNGIYMLKTDYTLKPFGTIRFSIFPPTISDFEMSWLDA